MKRTTWTALALAAIAAGGVATVAQEPNLRPIAAPQGPAAGSTHTGELIAVAGDMVTMTVKGKDSHSHRVNANTQVMLGNQPAKLADLRKGDVITVTMAADNVAAAIVAQRGGATDPGPQRPVAFQAQAPTNPNDASRQPNAPLQPNAQGQPNAAQPPNGRSPLRLGVHVAPSPTTGVLVQAVQPNGSAARAGIREGDYLLSADGKDLTAPDALSEALAGHVADDRVTFVVWRDGRKQNLDVVLFAASPDEVGQAGNRDATPWLGLNLGNDKDAAAVVVTGVYPSSPASRAGLLPGDRIVSIDGQKIAAPRDASKIVHGHAVGHACQVAIVRDGEEYTFGVTPCSRSDVFGNRPSTFAAAEDGFTDFQDDDVTETAMRLEHDRRNAEQHERIEASIRELREEIRQLRQELSGKKTP